MCVSYIDGFKKRASVSHACLAEPYRQHTHVIARACIGDKRTCTLTYLFHGISYLLLQMIYRSDLCVAIYESGHTHTHMMSPAASETRAIAHT